jgi:hypothetical protein
MAYINFRATTVEDGSELPGDDDLALGIDAESRHAGKRLEDRLLSAKKRAEQSDN